MELKVEGMTCQKCVQHVTRAIQEVDASAQVTIDLATQQVQPTPTPKRLLTVLKKRVIASFSGHNGRGLLTSRGAGCERPG
jgi:copper chaperone CopZ